MLFKELQVRNRDNKSVHCHKLKKNHFLEIEVQLPLKHPSDRINWKTFLHRLSGDKNGPVR